MAMLCSLSFRPSRHITRVAEVTFKTSIFALAPVMSALHTSIVTDAAEAVERRRSSALNHSQVDGEMDNVDVVDARGDVVV